MNRVGCHDCGDVIQSKYRHDFVTCSCGNVSADGGEDYYKRSFKERPPAELPTAADILAFRLRFTGRHDEATDVEDARAVLGEHT